MLHPEERLGARHSSGAIICWINEDARLASRAPSAPQHEVKA
jgi:hypothetical protein